MQAVTLPPWLSPWPPGGGGGGMYGPRKIKALDYYRAIARERARQRPRLTIYTYGHDDSQIFRIGGWSGRVNTPRPLAGWERYPLDPLASPRPLAGWERYPLDPLAPPPPRDLTHLPGRVNVEWMPPSPPPRHVRAWLAGTALVALLVVAVRVAEKYLDRTIFKRRPRRRSQEWPTPNVRATNRSMMDDGTVIIPGLEDAEPLPAEFSDTMSVDLPPPYSECTAPGAGPAASYSHNKLETDILHEEPPPPYSDCYVEFSNKNGIPSVLIFSRRRTPLVNRREIVGSETIALDDEATTSEQNMENSNTEMANARIIMDDDGVIPLYVVNEIESNNEATNAFIHVNSCVTAHGNPGTSTSEHMHDVSEDEYPNRIVVV